MPRRKVGLEQTMNLDRETARLSLTPRSNALRRIGGFFRNALQALLCLAPGAACTDKDSGQDSMPEDSAGSVSGFTYPRMTQAFHVGPHVFTNFFAAGETAELAADIKRALLGGEEAAICFTGDTNVQVAVQTEFIPEECSEYAKMEEWFALLDERLDAFKAQGFVVHLLLPVHQIPQDGWLDKNWQEEKEEWVNASTFVPYQPTVEEGNPYDVLSQAFHVPIIEHLVATGRAQSLAAIYVANEFGYTSKNDTAVDWGGDPNWEVTRQEALRSTLERLLENATVAAQGAVPIGAKFAQLKDPDTGWTPPTSQDPDQFDLLTQTMEANGNVLGYDLYISDEDPYDALNFARLSPFLARFKDGRFAITEFAYACQGDQGEFQTGRRTSASDILSVLSFWAQARGLNVFAWNATGPYGGCYSMTQFATGELFPEAQDTLNGMMQAVDALTGNADRNPCG